MKSLLIKICVQKAKRNASLCFTKKPELQTQFSNRYTLKTAIPNLRSWERFFKIIFLS